MFKLFLSIFGAFVLGGTLYAQREGGAAVASPELVGAAKDKGIEAKKETKEAVLKGFYEQEKYQELLDRVASWQNEKLTGKLQAMVLTWELRALMALDRVELLDALLEEKLLAYPQDFPVLLSVAGAYHMLAGRCGNVLLKDGKYIRQRGRGNGSTVLYSSARDQVRAMQLADGVRLSALANKDVEMQMQAQALMVEVLPYLAPLHLLSDWSKLPDYGEFGFRFFNHGHDAPPLAPDGSLAFYSVPKSFEVAKNNGERLRWLLDSLIKTPFSAQLDAQLSLAELLKAWSRMPYNVLMGFPCDFELKDNETILKLGKERESQVVALPEDQQYFPILQQLIALEDTKENADIKRSALQMLREFYFERKQYTKLKKVYDELRPRLEKDELKSFEEEYRLLFNPQCSFVEDSRQWIFSGKDLDVSLPIRYRNATELQLKVTPINVDRYMGNIFDLFKKGDNSHARMDWHYFLEQLSTAPFLVYPYMLPPVSVSTEKLHFDPTHKDSFAEFKIPLKQAGLFLVEIKMKGAAQPIYRLLGVSDMVIVQRAMPTGQFFYVADAATGLPEEGVCVDVCAVGAGHGVKMVQGKTNADGVWEWIYASSDNMNQYIVVARKGDKIAVAGMNEDLYAGRYRGSFDDDRSTLFAVNSQAAYRPGQTVNCRGWIGSPRYGAVEPLVLARQEITIELHSPRGEEIGKALKVKTDAYGGFSYEYILPESAPLGSYSLSVSWAEKSGSRRGDSCSSSHSFMVEEYKKPEFEVRFETPKGELRLGQIFAVTLQASAYSGGPVTHGEAEILVSVSPDNVSGWTNDPWFWLYKDGNNRGDYYGDDIVFSKTLPLDAEGKIHFDIDTADALKSFAGKNVNYKMSAEVRDASKRTIRASTNVRIGASPFDVFVQLDCGYALVNQPMKAQVHAQNIQGVPVVAAKGVATLFLQTYNVASKKWEEKEVQKMKLTTDHEGTASVSFSCTQGGLYRVLCELGNNKGEIGKVSKEFLVEASGVSLPPQEEALELLTDKLYYKSGETAKILVKTDRTDPSAVGLIFNVNKNNETRCLQRLDQRTKVVDYSLSVQDMPNIWVEAFSVNKGILERASVQIKIPPISKCLQADMKSSKPVYSPAEDGSLTLQVKDASGAPIRNAQVAVTIYDKALDYIGDTYPLIDKVFWGWTNPHNWHAITQSGTSSFYGRNQVRPLALGCIAPQYAHIEDLAGHIEEFRLARLARFSGDSVWSTPFCSAGNKIRVQEEAEGMRAPCSPVAMAMAVGHDGYDDCFMEGAEGDEGRSSSNKGAMQQISVRSDFLDMIKWSGTLQTDAQGMVVVPFKVAENLTTWMARAWVIDENLQVGSATAEFLCTKDFLLRLQAPRFFVEKDEVVLSAIVQNKTKTAQKSKVVLSLAGDSLSILGSAEQEVEVPAGGEVTVNWMTKAQSAGQVEVTMSARGSQDADAMKMSFPVLVHGMQQLDSWSCVLSPKKAEEMIKIDVPVDRKASESVLEFRVSPSLALSLLEAIPFLSDYPHGCAEQTLNRFAPSLTISHLLKTLKIKLPEEGRAKSLDSQQMQASVDATKREKNPLLIDKLKPKNLDKVTEIGVSKLANMQRSDGSWNWFSGANGGGDAYITAQIVQGLARAKAAGAILPDAMLKRAQNWLLSYELEQVRALDEGVKNKEGKAQNGKYERGLANERDAYVRVALSNLGHQCGEMQAYLVRDKKHLSMYGKILLAQELKLQKNQKALADLLPVITQFIEEDQENQTAWLQRDLNVPYWFWYNDDIESQAALLKLMVMLDPKSERTSRLAKWLINNRKNGSYWASTRDTAAAIDALAQYLLATQEGMEDQSYELLMDGNPVKIFSFNKDNLFTAENSFILTGEAVGSGAHEFVLRRVTGTSPLYVNASLSFFSLEDPLRAAGSDLIIVRSYTKVSYELKDKERRDPSGKIEIIKERVAVRQPLKTGDTIKSGELIEVQMQISSKNDLEYLCLIDPKPAGCELDDVKSGYIYDGLMAYREIGDQSVRYYLESLKQGTYTLKYTMRAERPGKFSALPSIIEAMYSPELRGNSTEQKLIISE